MLVDGVDDIVELKLQLFRFDDKPLNLVPQQFAPLLACRRRCSTWPRNIRTP